MRVTSRERVIFFLSCAQLSIHRVPFRPFRFFTERRHIRYVCPHKKGRSHARARHRGSAVCVHARTYVHVHVRGSCNSHISVHADDCSACNKLRSDCRHALLLCRTIRRVVRLHTGCRFQCLFFFFFFPPSPPLRIALVTTIRVIERAPNASSVPIRGTDYDYE